MSDKNENNINYRSSQTKDKGINLGTFTFDILVGDVLKENHGIAEIYSERQKQINKYGYTAQNQAENPQFYEDGQLVSAAFELLKIDYDDYPIEVRQYGAECPKGWDEEWFRKLTIKDKRDRIRIAAALLAAELDRLIYLENNK